MTTAPSTEPVATESGEDFFLSFTGFDEIAVARLFGSDVSELREKPFKFLRALVFVHQRRQGLKDPDAYKVAMNLTVGQVGDYFPQPESSDLDQLDSEAGKDGEPSS